MFSSYLVGQARAVAETFTTWIYVTEAFCTANGCDVTKFRWALTEHRKSFWTVPFWDKVWQVFCFVNKSPKILLVFTNPFMTCHWFFKKNPVIFDHRNIYWKTLTIRYCHPFCDLCLLILCLFHWPSNTARVDSTSKKKKAYDFIDNVKLKKHQK